MPRMTQTELDAYNARRMIEEQRATRASFVNRPGQTDTYNARRDAVIAAVLRPLLNDETPESEIQDQIEAECRRRGWYVVRSRMDRPTTTALGTPDFIVAIDAGRTLWVEVKRQGQKLRPEQAGAQAWLHKLGHLAAVVHSLEEFMTWIETV